MNKTAIATLITSALLVFAAQSQNLILNGSFESPLVPTNTWQATTPISWYWSGGTTGNIFNGSVPIGYDGYFADWPSPEDGQQFVTIGDDPSLQLSQDFTITNQGVYVLSWFDNAEQSGGLTTAPYTLTVITGAVQIVTSNSFDSYNATNAWGARSVSLTLSPGTYTLQFTSENYYGGLDTMIDNVSLVKLPDSDLMATIHFSAVDICWAGRTNQMYQVQYRTNLSDTSWFDLGSPVLGTRTNYVTDRIIGTPQRFYQVIRVP
jgi:hypothetical protein